MYIQQVNQDGVSIALIRSEKPLMTDVQSALDLMMTVRAETGCKRIALNREAITGDFFVLSTGIAGEILQKFVNYGFKLAIYGDFTHETSAALQDFIRESNEGRDIFFQPDANSCSTPSRERGKGSAPWSPSINTRKKYVSVLNSIARKGQGTKSLAESRGRASGGG